VQRGRSRWCSRVKSNASGSLPAHPLDVPDSHGAHADEAEILERVRDLVLGEEVDSALGSQRNNSPARPGVGTTAASRPPGRNTLTISLMFAVGWGISCSTASDRARVRFGPVQPR
jgi:hypothetical protein